jgi:hypothetical protein
MKRFFLAHLLVLGFAFVCSAGTRPLEEDQAVTIIIGPLVDDTGAALTALNVANIDCNLYKNNGTKVDVQLEASGTSNDCVHVEDGYYSLELTATETSTPGYLRITFQISGALLFHEDFTILPSNVYDSLHGSDKLQVDSVEVSSNTTAADQLKEAFDNNGTGGNLEVSAFSVTGTTTLTGNVTMQDGLTITRSTANQNGLRIAGNGSGDGVRITGGNTTGDALTLIGGAISGRAISGLAISGDAVTFESLDGNGHGLSIRGSGTGHGALFTGGSGATGNGIQATAASTDGNGLALIGTGSGFGLNSNFSALTTTSGRVDANVTNWLGTGVTVNVSGIPRVDVTHVLGDAVCD